MGTVLFGRLRRRAVPNARTRASQPQTKGRFGLAAPRLMGLKRRQPQRHRSDGPHGSARYNGSLLLAAFFMIAAVAVNAQTLDPPVVSLVTNMLQRSGPDKLTVLSGLQDGLFQEFTTGPKEDGYHIGAPATVAGGHRGNAAREYGRQQGARAWRHAAPGAAMTQTHQR